MSILTNSSLVALVVSLKNKPLTHVCSELMALCRSENINDELDFTYGEFAGLIHAAFQSEADEIIKRHGFVNSEVLRDVIRLRTTDKWAHFAPFSAYLCTGE